MKTSLFPGRYCSAFSQDYPANAKLAPPRCYQKDQNIYQDTCTMTCNSGYVPKDPRYLVATCQNDGYWGGRFTYCTGGFLKVFAMNECEKQSKNANNRTLRHTPCWNTKQYNLSPLGNEICCSAKIFYCSVFQHGVCRRGLFSLFVYQSGSVDHFSNDVIHGKALWKQSRFMTYRRYTPHFLVDHLFMPICSHFRLYICYLGEFAKNKTHRFQ